MVTKIMVGFLVGALGGEVGVHALCLAESPDGLVTQDVGDLPSTLSAGLLAVE
jgi:hypothetical protein